MADRTPIIAQHDAIRVRLAELAAERQPVLASPCCAGLRRGRNVLHTLSCPLIQPAADSLAADIIAMLRQLGLRVITVEEARREIPPPPPLYPPKSAMRSLPGERTA